MGRDDALIILRGLKLEFARKCEEIWSRGLEHGYENADHEHDRAVKALDMAIKALEAGESA